jgi:hypothetical protein
MSAKTTKEVFRLAVLLAIGSSGCGEPSAAGDPGADATNESPEPSAVETPALVSQPSPGPLPPVDGCIKGGTTRAEVTALLGQPDSTSFGVWLYGQSELSFGYGVVVAFADHDENLQLCPGA